MDCCGESEHHFYSDDEIEECCESFVGESRVYFNAIGAFLQLLINNIYCKPNVLHRIRNPVTA
jgi:hypothetical protein